MKNSRDFHTLDSKNYGKVMASKFALDQAMRWMDMRMQLEESDMTIRGFDSDHDISETVKNWGVDAMFGMALCNWASAHDGRCWLDWNRYQECRDEGRIHHFRKRRDKYFAHAELENVFFGNGNGQSVSPAHLEYGSEAADLSKVISISCEVVLEELRRILGRADIEPDDLDSQGFAYIEKIQGMVKARFDLVSGYQG